MSFPSSENFLGFWLRRKKQWAKNPIVMPHPRWSEADAQEFSFVLKAEGVAHYLLRIFDPVDSRPFGYLLAPLQMDTAEALKFSLRQIREKIVFSRNYKVPIPKSLSRELLDSFTPSAPIVWLDKTAPLPPAPDGGSTWSWNHHRTYKAHLIARQILSDSPVHLKGRPATLQLIHLDLKARGIPHQVWEHAQGYSVSYFSAAPHPQIELSGGTPRVVLEHPPTGFPEGVYV